ncbi:zinc ribbon domain-containing protein [Aspergillus lucknowensis]|uniref:C2H2-type domain-containing protein n=1 Tax=Aspergillus lucknowensis TaxID=176173 RepID=A0ABR4LSI0_9EURO
MSAFESPFDSVPSSPFVEAWWAGWNVDGSPGSAQDDGSFKLDSNWESSIYSLPDYYSLPFGNWSNQSLTHPSGVPRPDQTGSMGQFPDGLADITTWAPTLNTFSASLPSAAPILSPCTHDLTSQCNILQDRSTQQSCTTPSSNHSSPSESGPSFPTQPISSGPSKPKSNHASKTPIRCWEHSCGGRAFSSLGNYERHLREKSGRAKSFTCEQCGQRFTRSTAKNKHIRYGRCRMRLVR